MHKSHGGAGKSHGTAASRGQTPPSRGQTLDGSTHLVEPRDDETRGRAQGKTACGSETPKGVVTREADQSCEGNSKSHERRRKRRTFRPGCDNCPIRGPGTWLTRNPTTNDPRGRRLQITNRTDRRREALKTARANRPPGVGAGIDQAPKRNGSEAWSLLSGTAQPSTL